VTPNGYNARLLQLIATDVIAVYLTVTGIIKAETADSYFPKSTALWAVFAICLIATPLYGRLAGVKRPAQLIISALSFIVLSFADSIPCSRQAWTSILLPMHTFLIPLFPLDAFEKKDAEDGEKAEDNTYGSVWS
jgi:hypothetical protein